MSDLWRLILFVWSIGAGAIGLALIIGFMMLLIQTLDFYIN